MNTMSSTIHGINDTIILPTFLKEPLMKNIEIELRYQVMNPSELSDFFKPMEYLDSKHVVDTYLDTPDLKLYQRGIYVRIRNNKKLDIKFNRANLDNPNLPRQDYCEEHSFALPLQNEDLTRLNTVLTSIDLKTTSIADLSQIQTINNFSSQYVVDKKRTSYKHAVFTFCVDVLENFGTYLEIELMAQNADHIESVKKEMHLLLLPLSLQPLRLGYTEMVLRKNRFDDYCRGRYALEENKQRL